MKSQVLHTVSCNIAGEAAGEIWNWSLLGVKGLNQWVNVTQQHTVDTKLRGPNVSAPYVLLTALKGFTFKRPTPLKWLIRCEVWPPKSYYLSGVIGSMQGSQTTSRVDTGWGGPGNCTTSATNKSPRLVGRFLPGPLRWCCRWPRMGRPHQMLKKPRKR